MNSPDQHYIISSLLHTLTIITQRNISNKTPTSPIEIKKSSQKKVKKPNKKCQSSRSRQNCNSEDDDDIAEGGGDVSPDSKGKGKKVAGEGEVGADNGEGCDDAKDDGHNVLDTKAINFDGTDPKYGSIHYVDACTIWKFPIWLVERLDCTNEIQNHATMHIQQLRRTLLRQLKATAVDLLMYATVRREFLRTILVIELNNVARLLEVSTRIEVEDRLKVKFFNSLQSCVKVLEDQSKKYSDDLNALASIMNEIYTEVTPQKSFRDKGSYTYNNVYCSFLIPGDVMQFTEVCSNGIIDNNWFSLESRYWAMVMVTPHVFDDPKHIQVGLLKKEKFRVEAYFDSDEGRFTGFDAHLRTKLSNRQVGVLLEHLVYCYFTAGEQHVEEKGIFLMNGPETKGNLTFARIYHSLMKTASL